MTSGTRSTLTAIVDRGVFALARAWLLALFCYGLVVVLLPVLAPILRAEGFERPASAIYFLYQFICHQDAGRSFQVMGEPMAFCVRDLAIFGGAVGVAAIYALSGRFWRERAPGPWVVALATLPITLDGGTQLVGLRESTTTLRLLTGVVFSVGVGLVLLPRLDDGFRALRDDIADRVTRPLTSESLSTEATG